MKLVPIFLILPILLFSSNENRLTPAKKMMSLHNKPIRIEQVSSKGNIITLTNGEKYLVRDQDTKISGGWLLPAKVKIYKTNTPNVFIMKNLSTEAHVLVELYQN